MTYKWVDDGVDFLNSSGPPEAFLPDWVKMILDRKDEVFDDDAESNTSLVPDSENKDEDDNLLPSTLKAWPNVEIHPKRLRSIAHSVKRLLISTTNSNITRTK
jgi:hypothetical protein